MTKPFYLDKNFKTYKFDLWLPRAIKHRDKQIEEQQEEERQRLLSELKTEYKECYWCQKVLTGSDLRYSKKVQLNVCKECDSSLEAIISEKL